MPLREFKCLECKKKFETILSSNDTQNPPCPKCQSPKTERLLSSFRIAGQGDLRESTLHGCHEADPGPATDGGHSCTGHCSHGSATGTDTE